LASAAAGGDDPPSLNSYSAIKDEGRVSTMSCGERLMTVEYDKHKASENIKKHGVSFDEAITVFFDPLAKIFDDEFHSAHERRELIIGHSVLGRMLIVSFCERIGDKVRLISARPATKKERADYEDNQ
jgi:uncharacterized DUF497 family protein